MAADQGAQLLDGLDLDYVFGLEVDFLRLPVKEIDLPVLHVNGSAQLVVQVLHQIGDGMDLAQFVVQRVCRRVGSGCHGWNLALFSCRGVRVYCPALRGPSGMVRSMNWSNSGTVNAVSPWAGL